MALDVIILAAGLGTRMKSSTIKILHEAGGRPIVDYVLDLAAALSAATPVLVIGHQREAVKAHCGTRARYAVQEEQLGTGHAVMMGAAVLTAQGHAAPDVLVLSGDVPLTREDTLWELIDEHRRSGNSATILSMRLEEPAMYGRIIRDGSGQVLRIVEARDASAEEAGIHEVNGGIYVFSTEALLEALASLSSENAQGEYYLTDVIEIFRKGGGAVGAVIARDPVETLGVNSRSDLAMVEQELQQRKIQSLMEAGVTFRNPEATLVDTTVEIGRDTVVYPFVTLEGSTNIGERCVIEPGVHLRDVTVGNGVVIKTGTVAEDSVIEAGASVGPCAHLRPGTHLGPDVKIGNFVETKKATFQSGAKASHLSYIGDAEIGSNVNIGAGTITCNYDGVRKNKTTIEDGAFIGSDTQLIAPVTIGRGAYVGAGSTITKDVPAGSLALSRVPQKIIKDWAPRQKK
ncbi:MAG: bifunctional UDP-N-acetylglucosamine diphosphorylase/glucosamine-1-phosphate N-acetyltransferase GlmU [Acidobacteriota bacterium]